jgi:predicted RNase H-like HicB family nuclease
VLERTTSSWQTCSGFVRLVDFGLFAMSVRWSFCLTPRLQPRRAQYHAAPCALQAMSGLVAIGGYHSDMGLEFTAVFRKVPEGYIGFVEELPGANTQGATLEEARANLQEAVELVLQANRELIEEAASGGGVIREAFKVGA